MSNFEKSILGALICLVLSIVMEQCLMPISPVIGKLSMIFTLGGMIVYSVLSIVFSLNEEFFDGW